MNKKTLETIKKDLEDRRDKITKELAKFTAGDNNASDVIYPESGTTEEDNASEVAEYSDNLSLEDSLQSSLHDIQKALKSIANGTYGICRYCHQPIDEKRLLARPSSSSCISCKNKLIKNS